MIKSNREVINQLIDKAGGPQLPKYKELESHEQRTVIFNLWAAIFSVFYYLYHKMYKKALTYFLISWVANIVLGLVLYLIDFEISEILLITIPMAVIFGTRANIDLYKKERMGENNWF